MVNFDSILNDIISWAAIGLLAVLVSFVWRLVKIISKIEEFMVRIEKRTELSEARLEVNDAIVSDILGSPVDSKRIAEGYDDRPIYSKKPIRDC